MWIDDEIVVPRDRPEAGIGRRFAVPCDRGFLPQAPEPLERDALDEVVRVGEVDPIDDGSSRALLQKNGE